MLYSIPKTLTVKKGLLKNFSPMGIFKQPCIEKAKSMPNKQENKLKAIRKAFGLTLKGFSEQLGIPIGTYKKYEYGERRQPFWLNILIKKYEYEILLKNKDIHKISTALVLFLKEQNWNTFDIEKLIKAIKRDVKNNKGKKNIF